MEESVGWWVRDGLRGGGGKALPPPFKKCYLTGLFQ